MADLSWRDAVIIALERNRGKASTKKLGEMIPEIKNIEVNDSLMKHNIRSSLDYLRIKGFVERVGYGVWRLKK